MFEEEIPGIFDKKILVIGNSFSIDATYYLRDIVKAYTGMKDTKLKIGVMYHGSSYAKKQWEVIKGNDKTYFQYYENGLNKGGMGVEEVLFMEKWDIIILQHFTAYEGLMEEYNTGEYAFSPYLVKIAEFVNNKCSEVEIMVHQTWSYEVGFEVCSEVEQQRKMTENSCVMNKRIADEISIRLYNEKGKVKVIPSGEVMQYARESKNIYGKMMFMTEFSREDLKTLDDKLDIGAKDYSGEKIKLNRDGFHASMPGRFLLALVWFKFIFGKDFEDIYFLPTEEMDILSMGYDYEGNTKSIYLSFEKIPEEYIDCIKEVVRNYFEEKSKGYGE